MGVRGSLGQWLLLSLLSYLTSIGVQFWGMDLNHRATGYEPVEISRTSLPQIKG